MSVAGAGDGRNIPCLDLVGEIIELSPTACSPLLHRPGWDSPHRPGPSCRPSPTGAPSGSGPAYARLTPGPAESRPRIEPGHDGAESGESATGSPPLTLYWRVQPTHEHAPEQRLNRTKLPEPDGHRSRARPGRSASAFATTPPSKIPRRTPAARSRTLSSSGAILLARTISHAEINIGYSSRIQE